MNAIPEERELGARFDAALLFATEAHRAQRRKFSGAPYVAHPLRVAALALEYGADEDVAVAALLHDVVEDCGGLDAADKIRVEFGERVASIVLECSDSIARDPTRKLPWSERKRAFLLRALEASDDALLVVGCDKLDNLASLLRDLSRAEDSEVVWRGFKGGRDGTANYYRSALNALERRNNPTAREIRPLVERLEASVGGKATNLFIDDRR